MTLVQSIRCDNGGTQGASIVHWKPPASENTRYARRRKRKAFATGTCILGSSFAEQSGCSCEARFARPDSARYPLDSKTCIASRHRTSEALFVRSVCNKLEERFQPHPHYCSPRR